ncbi:MAG TPA: hypothetical protein VFG42_09650 [Baekduia sp.]|uniref:hypothetical protein n=1 Tax=Baekduia sp. TaxID=2600305 RepID=UPI002D7934A5|nr:hypothetical protein [Baekduia sp.]HET6507043.1 hypothetical protein [Baekduia sp.]
MLPAGTFTLSADDHRAFARHVGGDPDGDPTVTALWLIVSDLRGLGIGLGELFARHGIDLAHDGPMLGGVAMAFDGPPLALDRPYPITGEVLDRTRKSGRRGAFDVLRVRVALADVAAVTISYILPRRDEEAAA